MHSEFQTALPPHTFRIPVEEPHPPPSEFQNVACSMGTDIFWNHPIIQAVSFMGQALGKLTDCKDDFACLV